MSSAVLDRQLLAYTLAGGAGMLAAGSADAAIIYSGLLNQSVTFGSSYAIDFDGGGTDLTLQLIQSGGGAFHAQSVSTSTTGVFSPTLSVFATNFASGDSVGGGGVIGNTTKTLASYDSAGTLFGGEFPGNATGFLGFTVGTDIGWVRLSFGGPLNATTGYTVVDWAYDNTGAVIRAGQTTSGAVPLPGAAALAALAAGASGLRGRRGRERAA